MPNPDRQSPVAEPVAPAPLAQGKSLPSVQQQLRLAPTHPAQKPDEELPAAAKPARKRKVPVWLLCLRSLDANEGFVTGAYAQTSLR